MLAMLFVVAVSYLLRLAHLEISIKMESAIITIAILVLLLLMVYLLVHKLLINSAEEKAEYVDSQYEPGVIISGVIFSCTASALMCILLACVGSTVSMIVPIIIALIIMAILDVINIIVFYNTATFDFKEALKFSIVRQMELMMYALFIMIGIALAVKFTLLGGLIITYIIIRFALIFRR